MHRRTFLSAGVTAAGATALLPGLSSAAEESKTARQFFEIRAYTLASAEKRELFDGYFEKAAIPALNKLGVKSVGVFHATEPAEKPAAYVLLPYASLEQFTAVAAGMLDDAELQKAGAEYLGVGAKEPVYERIESWLTRGFEGMPGLESPKERGRLFQLRIYESHSENASRKKIEMFNRGEIAIFQKVGLTPVFFGETMIGPRMPNLTYLLSFPDKAAHDAAWNTFRVDPEWLKLRAIPEYADANIVSKITNIVLKPAECSQI